MCGIFAILNNPDNITKNDIDKNFQKGKNRGPEYSNFNIYNEYNLIAGFHRLAINGTTSFEKSNQPFFIKNCMLICNGEIYNWKELFRTLDIQSETGSDCEIIIHLYRKYGIQYTLQILDGVFAFMLVDIKSKEVYIARDTYGIRPLFYTKQGRWPSSFYFASELKQLTNLVKNKINQFPPGTYSKFNASHNTYINEFNHKIFSSPNSFLNSSIDNKLLAYSMIRKSLEDAVKKRIDNTDREIACLLSGGLDSSLITALVKKFHKGDLHTWSIGFKGSEDLKYAQLVADKIGTIHHSIEVEESEFLDVIPEVIYNIESYDTTTVRASVGNWLISKYIKENSNAKVIFNGDGSDELTGGYLYFYLAENALDFDKECRRLLSDIHYFDVLRSDRSISSHGLEARTPFLDRGFVQTYLSISKHFRFHVENKECEKHLLRNSFSNENLLPDEVLWRTKEAFSDGVSKKTKSWHNIVQEYIKNHVFKNQNINFLEDERFKNHNQPKTLEQYYYRTIFETYFNNRANVIPYYWMPKFTDSNDASARNLNIYDKIQKTQTKENKKTTIKEGSIENYLYGC